MLKILYIISYIELCSLEKSADDVFKILLSLKILAGCLSKFIEKSFLQDTGQEPLM